jgi:hypothetical protein
MWRWMKPIRTIGLGALVLAAGCTVSVQPWTKPSAPATPPPDGLPVGHPGTAPPFNAPPARPLPQNLNTPNEATAVLEQRLYQAENQRDVYLNQVKALQKQVKEREENLRTASLEMDESSKHLKRTRDEFRQWQADIDELRDRVRKLEDYRATLKPLIEETLQHLNREKDAPGNIRIPLPGK